MPPSLALFLLSVTIAVGCTGETTATDPHANEAAQVELNEGWKRLTLPNDGALVEFSTDVSLKLSYPTHTQDTAGGIVGELSSAIEKRGYVKGKDKKPSSTHVVQFDTQQRLRSRST